MEQPPVRRSRPRRLSPLEPLPRLLPDKPRARMSPFPVSSLDEVRELIRDYGELEEVQIRVQGTIPKLADAQPMRALLRDLVKRKCWVVINLDILTVLSQVAHVLAQAADTVGDLERLTDRQLKLVVDPAFEDLVRDDDLKGLLNTEIPEILEATYPDPVLDHIESDPFFADPDDDDDDKHLALNLDNTKVPDAKLGGSAIKLSMKSTILADQAGKASGQMKSDAGSSMKAAASLDPILHDNIDGQAVKASSQIHSVAGSSMEAANPDAILYNNPDPVPDPWILDPEFHELVDIDLILGRQVLSPLARVGTAKGLGHLVLLAAQKMKGFASQLDDMSMPTARSLGSRFNKVSLGLRRGVISKSDITLCEKHLHDLLNKEVNVNEVD